jgi:DNA-binding Lrp family transcriptional regulator
MLTPLEKKIIAAIQGDIPVTRRPYRDLSRPLGIAEETFILALEDLCRRGVIRRFGATLRHQKSGYSANAMGAWKVEENRIGEVGRTMAAAPEVSHCYRRDPAAGWPYNLYTMIHARDEDACRAVARRLADQTAVTRYSLLFSRRELKKTSMQYFSEGEGG